MGGIPAEVEKLLENSKGKSFKMIRERLIQIIFISVLIFIPLALGAQTILKQNNIPIENRFVVSPAKIEVEINGGESKEVLLNIENRMGREQSFAISFEDFVGSDEVGQTIRLLGDLKSERSLKDFFFTEEKTFNLDHGDRLVLPVSISIPAETNPGGLFGSIIVSALNETATVRGTGRAYTGATIIGRAATLVFATVPGETEVSGEFLNFNTKNNKKLFFSGRIPTRLVFENTGNINLNPYGGITVKNTFGKKVGAITLDPWYVLPDSVRTRDVVIKKDGMFGRYTAIAEVNRGYDDVVDTREISFYVFPPALTSLAVIVLGFIAFALYRKNSLSKKSDDE